MPQPIQVLVVEDNPNDAELVLRELRRAGFDPAGRRVDTEAEYLASLRPELDLILSDFEMPQFNGLRALELLTQSGLDIPFIIVSGTIGEETAVAAMKRGATDYLLKDRLARLGPAVSHALEQSRLRRESRQAVAALRLFRTLVDRSNDAFVVLDPESGRILDVNEKVCQDLGYTRQEMLALKVFDISPTVTAATWAPVARLIRERGFRVLESEHIRKDGTIFPIEVNSKWVQLDRDYIIAIVRDITERKEAEVTLRDSEERFRQLAENINEVFWITNPAKGEILYISPAFEDIWGRSCQSLYDSNTKWSEAIHPDDRARVLKDIADRQERGEYNVVYRILRPDGEVRWIHDRAFPIRNEAGQVYRIVGTAEDISLQHKLEEQYRRAQKMEAIGTLAGGIAHDFNNILAAMTGYTELAKMKLGDNPLVQGYMESVMQAGHRATALVRQILTFSRQQEQQERRSTHIGEVMDEALKLLRSSIPTTIEFVVTKEPGVAPILADSTQIHQIMMNLGTNAWHAMRDRPGRLEVKLENFEVDKLLAELHPRLRPGPYVRLSVGDTGCGMDAATLERIFEPFFTTKPSGEGTGLGLAVVHGIMESHDGVVTVYSHPGKGTIFHLYFPAYHEQVALPPASTRTTPLGAGQRILYVDDEPALANLGQKTLEQLGYEVTISTKVAEALELVRQAPARFDLVITDQTMPGMTGTDFAAQLLKIRLDLPIILTTGYSPYLTVERVHAMGLRDLLLKPQSLQALGQAVHHALTAKEPD